MAERGRQIVRMIAASIGSPPRLDLAPLLAALRTPPRLAALALLTPDPGPPGMHPSPGRDGKYDYQQRLRNRRRRARKGTRAT